MLCAMSRNPWLESRRILQRGGQEFTLPEFSIEARSVWYSRNPTIKDVQWVQALRHARHEGFLARL